MTATELSDVEDYAIRMEMCGLGDTDGYGDFSDSDVSTPPRHPMLCECGHELDAHGYLGCQHEGCFVPRCGCAKFRRAG